jgi:hypothetical protein
MRWLVASLSITLLASCNQETSSAPSGTGGAGGSAAAKPAGGGFSADLAKEFANATGSGSGSGDAKAGSGDAAARAGSGDAAARAGSGGDKSGDAKAGDTKMGDTKTAGDAKAGDMKAGDTKTAGDAKAGDTKAGDAKAGDAKATDTKTADAKAGDTKPAAPDTAPKGTSGAGLIVQSGGGPTKKITVPAELAAIKFGMLPNWDRDVQEAGTLSLAVKIPGSSSSAVFVFRYGYEDPGAPAEREAYKKWLADKRLLTVRQDRQAGSSWFLEGNDGSGRPAFRVVVSWGGKKLICYGSLYRDAESSRLGDLRDQTVLQAKQICESIAL